jgi:hypothetical protein
MSPEVARRHPDAVLQNSLRAVVLFQVVFDIGQQVAGRRVARRLDKQFFET